MSVTRAEVADQVHAAFTSGPATRDTLLTHAAGMQARRELIEVLRGLPAGKSYSALRDLWYDLAHLPVER